MHSPDSGLVVTERSRSTIRTSPTRSDALTLGRPLLSLTQKAVIFNFTLRLFLFYLAGLKINPMKLFAYSCLFALLFAACADPKMPENTSETTKNSTTPTPETDKPTMTGNDADAHGCRASAGYTWSAAKNECIRIWETGNQLEQIKAENGSTSTAMFLYNADSTQVELFVATETGGLMMPKTQAGFAAKGYELAQAKGQWTLKKNGIAIYKK
jgi:hypothetical protein